MSKIKKIVPLVLVSTLLLGSYSSLTNHVADENPSVNHSETVDNQIKVFAKDKKKSVYDDLYDGGATCSSITNLC